MPQFSYVCLTELMARVTCACGWEGPLERVSPFDPAEAIAAAHAAHSQCLPGNLRPMPDITANEYQKAALRTEVTPGFINPAWIAHYNDKNPNTPLTARMVERYLHALLGIASELGELADPIKKALIYDKPIDTTEIKGELGDLPWYVGLGADSFGFQLGDVLASNVAKLKARFGDKFTQEKGLVRDLDAERRALEGEGG